MCIEHVIQLLESDTKTRNFSQKFNQKARLRGLHSEEEKMDQLTTTDPLLQWTAWYTYSYE